MQKANIPIDLREQVFSRADSNFYLFEEDEIRERMARQYEEDDEYEWDDE